MNKTQANLLAFKGDIARTTRTYWELHDLTETQLRNALKEVENSLF